MGGETVAFLLIGSLSPRQHPDAKQAPPSRRANKDGGGDKTRARRGLRVCAGVPEIGGRGPLQSQAGHVHGGVHQQEEDGHDAGDGVELPGEKDQLVRNRDSGGGGGVNTGEHVENGRSDSFTASSSVSSL